MLYSASAVTLASTGLPDLVPRNITIFGITITDTMLTFMLVSALIMLVALVIRIFFIPRWRKSHSTGGFRMLTEGVVSLFDNTAKSTVGKHAGFVGAWYFAMGLLICIGTLTDLVALRPPTSDINLTLMLGLTTFIIIQFYGIKVKKWRRIKRYVPNILNILTDCILPFSMALRLFGSIFSGYMIMELIYTIPFPIVYPLLGNILFTFFHAFMQTYIFMMLSMNFVAEAIE